MASALGWSLAKMGIEFFFIARTGPIQHAYAFNVDDHLLRIKSEVPKDLAKTAAVFFCVKSYDLAASFQHLALFPQRVIAISLSNGAVNKLIEAGLKAFPQHEFRPGFSTMAVNKKGQNEFVLGSSKGEFQFGPLTSDDEETSIEKTLTAGGSPFVWNSRILLYQRRKWLFNTVINTLTAARKLPRNGDLLSDLPMLTAVFTEAYHLGAELWGRWGFEQSELFSAMLTLIRDTEANENSMAADIRHGRKTESDFLAGLAVGKVESKYPLLTALHAQL
jgi:ketopantoate reductase